MQLTLPYYANILRWTSAGLTLLPKEILSRPADQWRCNRKAQRPCLHSHGFSQTDNGVLGGACWNLSESSYKGLQSVGCYWWWYWLNSQTAFTFWITLVITVVYGLMPLVRSPIFRMTLLLNIKKYFKLRVSLKWQNNNHSQTFRCR
jgi:hypothetical protein